MIAKADIRRVQEWMGHADIQTTMKYLHYAPREEDAALVDEAFRLGEPLGAPTEPSAKDARPHDSQARKRGIKLARATG
jgi:hypothetical protein